MAIKMEKRLWTVEEYLRIAETGIFADERVELIEGEIVKMAAQGTRHIRAVMAANEALVLTFHTTHSVACQVSLVLGERTCLEPDFNLVRKGTLKPTEVPHDGDLVLEISETSLSFDRNKKASLYARKGVADYWIANVVKEVVEVYRKPQPDPSVAYGYRYTQKTIYRRGERIQPLCREDVTLEVNSLLHPLE